MKIKRIQWIVFAVIMGCIGLSLLSMHRLISKQIQIQSGHQIKARFFVLFPGKYTAALVFDRTKPGSYSRLKKTLGNFGCKNTYTGTPCGSFENYDFDWVIDGPGQRRLDGNASPATASGGWLSHSEWALGIAKVDLNFGFHTLTFIPHNGLTSVNVLNPKLVLNPGHGAKTMQSDFTIILAIAGSISLYGILPLFLIVSYVIYIFKTRHKTVAK